jgi:Polyketide cyclase / dehydrase and lipid transport
MARRAEATAPVVLDPDAAAALWRDVRRWAGFVEGFQRLEEAGADWPGEGAKVVWVSGPGGRGRVTEKVVATGPTSFTTRVHEQRLHGTQTAAFAPGPAGGSSARLTLEYELADGNPLNAITDLLFIRRAVRDSLARTLSRFAVEAQDEAGLR